MLKHPLLLQTQRHAHIVVLILLFGEVILLYFYCAKEGLIYIIIVAPFSRQPSFYFKCTQLNIHSFYNVWSISNAECILYLYPLGSGNTR